MTTLMTSQGIDCLTGSYPNVPEISGYFEGSSISDVPGCCEGSLPDIPEAPGCFEDGLPDIPDVPRYLGRTIPDIPDVSGYLLQNSHTRHIPDVPEYFRREYDGN